MEILVLKAKEIIEEEKYLVKQKDLLENDFETNGKDLVKSAIGFVKENYEKNGFALFKYQITDLANLSVNFFSNIINLPYLNAKKYVEFFEDGASVPIKFYFSVDSPNVNKSKLWIEEIGNLDQNLKKIEELLHQTRINLESEKTEKDLKSNEKNSKK